MRTPILPKVTDSPEVHADWLEWQSLSHPEHYIAWADHQRDLRIGGYDDTEAEEAEGSTLEVLTDDVAAELCDRGTACGGDSGSYPFEVTREGVAYRPTRGAAVYEFLLSLTLLGQNAGAPGQRGDQLFEDLCAEVFRAYLGDSAIGLRSKVVGFPRRNTPKGFADAVRDLCREIGEGDGPVDEPEVSRQKDAHLDIVVWRSFPDRKPGQLIAFGQCATGDDWFEKIHELQPANWCKLWLSKQPLVPPIAGFFVPRRVEQLRWRRTSVSGGIFFDRCRISWLVSGTSEELETKISLWNRHAFARGEG